MNKVLFPLGSIFLLVGYFIIGAINSAQTHTIPNLLEQQGTVSKVDIYPTPKFGEVFYFELTGIETRFWLKARMQSDTKTQLLEDVKVGDQVTVFYTSLVGTQYEYSAAPFSVKRLEKAGKSIMGLDALNDPGPSRFMVIFFYVLGGFFMLLGAAFIAVVVFSLVITKK
jgi:uncharacterized membrane protein YedE/YeeE